MLRFHYCVTDRANNNLEKDCFCWLLSKYFVETCDEALVLDKCLLSYQLISNLQGNSVISCLEMGQCYPYTKHQGI